MVPRPFKNITAIGLHRMQTQISNKIRHDWQVVDILAIYQLPLPDLFFRAQTIHREFHDPNTIQGCILLSIKTGGCPEDCGYCPQSSHYETNWNETAFECGRDTPMRTRCSHQGATRFCMGAAWRSIPKGSEFEKVLQMVRGRSRNLGWKPAARWECCLKSRLSNSRMLA